MWPFDAAPAHEVLRIGPLAVERWAGSSAGLSLVNRDVLPATAWHQPDVLVDAVRSLYRNQKGAKVTLVLESGWLPLLLADAGTGIWNQAQIEALLRHRLSLLYDDAVHSVSSWDLRVAYRPGERFALGYGLSPPVRQALMAGGESAGLQWAAMVPALDWGWQRLRPSRHWPHGNGWWLWPEQDRMLVAWFSRGQMAGLNAGASLAAEPLAIEALVDVESLRLGVEAQTAPIDAAAWAEPPQTSGAAGRLTWNTLCAKGAASAAAAGRTRQASGVPV